MTIKKEFGKPPPCPPPHLGGGLGGGLPARRHSFLQLLPNLGGGLGGGLPDYFFMFIIPWLYASALSEPKTPTCKLLAPPGGGKLPAALRHIS